MNASVRQWKRVSQVVVGKAGAGLLIQDLRIVFEVKKTIEPTPNSAEIKIYNLNQEHEEQIKNEFDDVLLNAGYSGAAQMIFRGNIQHVYRYRDKMDWITQIIAGDGDQDFQKATMNETLAAGTTPDQVVSRAVASFMGGTTRGHIVTKAAPLPRGKVISGNTRTILDRTAKESGANWSIQDGQLVMVPTSDTLPTEAIVLTYETGLLSAPEVNDKGVAAACLMNPQIRVNGKIKLDNNTIKAKVAAAPTLAGGTERAQAAPAAPVRLDPDGIYKVLQLTHKGDTRGQDFKTEVECIGLGQPIPPARTATIEGS